jgi:uncharacterized protein YbaR (Trm112 family)
MKKDAKHAVKKFGPGYVVCPKCNGNGEVVEEAYFPNNVIAEHSETSRQERMRTLECREYTMHFDIRENLKFPILRICQVCSGRGSISLFECIKMGFDPFQAKNS